MFTGGHGKSAAMSSQCRPPFYSGANGNSRLCRSGNAPKGRVISNLQKCQTDDTLPNQFTGGQRTHAAMPHAPRPHFVFGAIRDQRLRHSEDAPKGRVNMTAHKCHIICTLPNQFTGGQPVDAAMPPPPRPHQIWATLSSAEMPFASRPITRGQPLYAEMPTPLRLATKKGK